MASSPHSDSVEGESDSSASDSPRNNLVVKLIKLEDQLGLTRWTTLAEVKQEPVDDYSDDDMAQIDDCGMEWVPVKVENSCAEEAEIRSHNASPSDMCLNRSDTVGGEAVHSVLNTCLNNGSLRETGDGYSPVSCIPLTPLVNGTVASTLSSSQASVDNTVSSLADSGGDSSVAVSPEVCPVDSTTTTSPLVLGQDSPPCQVNSTVISQSPKPSCPTTSPTTDTVPTTSPQVPRRDSFNINSSRVEFLGQQNRTVDSPTMEGLGQQNRTVDSPMMEGLGRQNRTVDCPTMEGLGRQNRTEDSQAMEGLGRQNRTVDCPTMEGLGQQNRTVDSPAMEGLGRRNRTGDSATMKGNPFELTMMEGTMDVDIASSQLTVLDEQTVRGLEAVVAATTSSPSFSKLASKRADRHAHRKQKTSRKSRKGAAKKVPVTEKKTLQKQKGKTARTSKNPVNVVDSVDCSTNSVPRSKDCKAECRSKQSKSSSRFRQSKLESRSKGRKCVSESKDTGMFPMHPTLGKRVQSGTLSAFNLFRLSQHLPSEAAAVEFGQHYKLLPRFRYCPSCGQRLDKMYRITRQGKRPLFRFQCNKQPCKQSKNQVPLRWGTKFMSSNISIRKAIILDYCFVKKYDIPTAKSESAIPEYGDSDRMLSTSTETVVDYYNNCREICAYSIMSSPPIGGLGYTVELFQSFFVGSKSHNEGGSKSHKVHAFQGQYILAGICIENNDVLFAVAPDLEPSNILPLLQSKVALGTHIRTSSCEAYKHLKQFGYEHTIVKESQLFVHNDLSFSGCSNTSQAGTMRPLTFHRRSGTFNLHLAEYLWRRKHREANDVFLAYLESVGAVFPLKVTVKDDQAEDG